jgi:holliday junction DNA helicase RuvA
MIARLKGIIDAVGEADAIIDVRGVGYFVMCSARTLRSLPSVGEAVTLEIETHVREDHIHLFGFTDAQERDWFRILQTVQGVGAKVALGIQSTLSAAEIGASIAAQDHVPLTAANGVGPKVAKRIVAELKDKAPAPNLGAALAASVPAESQAAGMQADAVSALMNLGYGRTEAFGAVARVLQQSPDNASVESLITSGLKELAQ